MNKYQINVTAADIQIASKQLKEGKSRAFHCPISKAAKRRFKVRTAATTGFMLYIKRAQYELPEAARDFTYAFDHGEEVKPIRFTVEGE